MKIPQFNVKSYNYSCPRYEGIQKHRGTAPFIPNLASRWRLAHSLGLQRGNVLYGSDSPYTLTKLKVLQSTFEKVEGPKMLTSTVKQTKNKLSTWHRQYHSRQEHNSHVFSVPALTDTQVITCYNPHSSTSFELAWNFNVENFISK